MSIGWTDGATEGDKAMEWYEADIIYDAGRPEERTTRVDLRQLAAWRLRVLRDEAATAGDESMVTACTRVLEEDR